LLSKEKARLFLDCRRPTLSWLHLSLPFDFGLLEDASEASSSEIKEIALAHAIGDDRGGLRAQRLGRKARAAHAGMGELPQAPGAVTARIVPLRAKGDRGL
jgi:hypothetical protein